MRIRFLSDQVYETAGPGKGPKFPKGLVLDAADVGQALGLGEVSEAYAEAFLLRWVQRNVAIALPDAEAVEAVAETVPVSEPAEPKSVPVSPAEISQPLGTAKRGRPSAGNEK